MPISKEKKEEFKKYAGPYKEEITQLKEKIKNLEEEKNQTPEEKRAYIDFKIIDIYLDMIQNYLNINDVAVSTMGIKHEDSLDEARKILYKVLIILEKLTTPVIDISLKDVVKYQQKFSDFSDADRLNLVNRLFFLIQQLDESYGANSKWRYSFVEIRGRAANIAKNILNYLALAKNDPRMEGFYDRIKLRDLVEDKLIASAKEYREKYEISGHLPDDMKKAVSFLNALRRLYILENKRTEIEKIKKTIRLWLKKMETDFKKSKKK